jgi:hypothetical protein
MDYNRSNVPDRADLTKLGFPRFLIDAGVRLRERGLADIQPPAELVATTVAACERALRELVPFDEEEANGSELHKWIGGLLAIARLPPEEYAFARAAALSMIDEGVPFALQHFGRPPAYAVESHCITEPQWWPEQHFLPVWRSATELADKMLLNRGSALVRRVVVLRQRVDDYDEQTLKMLRLALETETSDMYWFPCQAVMGLVDREFAVIARRKVFEVRPTETVKFLAIDNAAVSDRAIEICEELDRLAVGGHALRIRNGGKLLPEAKAAVERGTQGILALLDATISA